jgi:hypothetical protein
MDARRVATPIVHLWASDATPQTPILALTLRAGAISAHRLVAATGKAAGIAASPRLALHPKSGSVLTYVQKRLQVEAGGWSW